MQKENNLDDKQKNKDNINKSDKKNQNNNKDINIDDIDFDINNFCPNPEDCDKKVRRHTVRESVKKGKLKKLMEEEKANKIDPRKYLKTPQVMVPRLRPQKRSLNPTPLKLNPFSLKSNKLNIINEENIILSEHEEESEHSESSSSSDSFSDIENNKEEEEEKNENEENKIEEEMEEDKDEEKKDENINQEVKKNDIKPSIGILGCLMKEKNKEESKFEEKNEDEEKKDNDDNIYKNKIIEDKAKENEQLSLKEIRKNMKEAKKTFKRKNKDVFNLIDSNIKNHFKKFKEDVLDEEKNDDDIYNNEKDEINEVKNTQKCCPILDFYIKNSSLIKSKA